ncbi:hypothetical protein GQ53DRAFT_740246 [Thozetella sp. PMI_491]|nr:hypothetical protein GQ53DRAFT_740246 [Thozetella sp. PMI_491]
MTALSRLLNLVLIVIVPPVGPYRSYLLPHSLLQESIPFKVARFPACSYTFHCSLGISSLCNFHEVVLDIYCLSKYPNCLFVAFQHFRVTAIQLLSDPTEAHMPPSLFAP